MANDNLVIKTLLDEINVNLGAAPFTFTPNDNIDIIALLTSIEALIGGGGGGGMVIGDPVTGGANKNVLFVDGVNLAQNTRFTFDKTTKALDVDIIKIGAGVKVAITENSGNLILTGFNSVRVNSIRGSNYNLCDISGVIFLTINTTNGRIDVQKPVVFQNLTTAAKLALTPLAGMQVFDTTLNQMSYYNGAVWINF